MKIEEAQRTVIDAARYYAAENFISFVLHTKPDYEVKDFHRNICSTLDQFEVGKIKKLMIFMPPQHGKSELTTRRFPAYLLGKNPKRKIVIGTYSATLASVFNRDCQRVIDDDPYHKVFPDTTLNESNVVSYAKGNYVRNSEIFETVKHRGFVKTVGRGGALTGTPVDIGIIDDPIKDRAEAMSLTIRESLWSWFTDVFETRMHNDSQIILIQTRWHEDDLAGRILKRDNDWKVLKYPAIKEGDINDYDHRKPGQALWPERHSLNRLNAIKRTAPYTFNSLYQQDPKPNLESLIFPNWSECPELPEGVYFYGLDFGFSNDPTAITKMTFQSGNLYCKQVAYSTQMTADHIARAIMSSDYRGQEVYCDHNPMAIAALRELGINSIRAEKGPGSVEAGIDLLNRINVYYTRDSNAIREEKNAYQWLMNGSTATNTPIDEMNHAIDSIRYGYVTKYKRKKAGYAGI